MQQGLDLQKPESRWPGRLSVTPLHDVQPLEGVGALCCLQGGYRQAGRDWVLCTIAHSCFATLGQFSGWDMAAK